MTQSTWAAAKGYGVALLTVAVCSGLAEIFRPVLITTPTMLFTIAVIAAGWYGGLGPGLVATALSLLAINFFLFRPFHSFHIDHSLHWPRLALFCFTGLVTSWLLDALQRTRMGYEAKKRELWTLQVRYERIIETAREGTWILDAEGRTCYISNRMLEMLGYAITEISRHALWEFLEPDSAREAQQLWEERWLGAQEEHCFCFRRKDGSSFWGLVASNPLYDNKAQFAGAVCMVTEGAPVPTEEIPSEREAVDSSRELPIVS